MRPWRLATVSEILEQLGSLQMPENVKILTCPVLFFNLSTFSRVQTQCFISIPRRFCICGFKKNLSKSTALTLAQIVSSPHALNVTFHTQPLAQNSVNLLEKGMSGGLLLSYFAPQISPVVGEDGSWRARILESAVQPPLAPAGWPAPSPCPVEMITR